MTILWSAFVFEDRSLKDEHFFKTNTWEEKKEEERM